MPLSSARAGLAAGCRSAGAENAVRNRPGSAWAKRR